MNYKKYGGKFFSNKDLDKAKWGTLPNRLSNMEPYKKAPAGHTGAWAQEVFVSNLCPTSI